VTRAGSQELLTERSWKLVLLLAGEYDVGLPPRNAAEYDDSACFTRNAGGFLG
jgi:hypothetical protein